MHGYAPQLSLVMVPCLNQHPMLTTTSQDFCAPRGLDWRTDFAHHLEVLQGQDLQGSIDGQLNWWKVKNDEKMDRKPSVQICSNAFSSHASMEGPILLFHRFWERSFQRMAQHPTSGCGRPGPVGFGARPGDVRESENPVTSGHPLLKARPARP